MEWAAWGRGQPCRSDCCELETKVNCNKSFVIDKRTTNKTPLQLSFVVLCAGQKLSQSVDGMWLSGGVQHRQGCGLSGAKQQALALELALALALASTKTDFPKNRKHQSSGITRGPFGNSVKKIYKFWLSIN